MRKLLYFAAVFFSITVYKFEGFGEVRKVGGTWQNEILNKYSEHKESDSYFKKCNFLAGKLGEVDTDCVKHEGGGVIWGDSHAAAISMGIREVFPEIALNQLTTSGCRISFEYKSMPTFREEQCYASNGYAMKVILDKQPELVIVAQEKLHSKVDFLQLFGFMEAAGVQKLIVLGPVPQWRPSLPLAVAKSGGKIRFLESTFLDQTILEENEIASAMVEELRLGFDLEVVYVDLIGFFCAQKSDSYEHIRCNIWADFEESELIIFDYGHLTLQGSILVSDRILRAVI